MTVRLLHLLTSPFSYPDEFCIAVQVFKPRTQGIWSILKHIHQDVFLCIHVSFMLPTFDIVAKMQDNTDYLSRHTLRGSSEAIKCYSQVHCAIWGVQGVQEGQGGLVNQLPGLPVRRQGVVKYRRKRQNFFFSLS